MNIKDYADDLLLTPIMVEIKKPLKTLEKGMEQIHKGRGRGG